MAPPRSLPTPPANRRQRPSDSRAHARRVGAFLGAAVSLLVLAGCIRPRETFMPLGLYRVPDTNDFRAVRAAGFNVITGNADPGWMRAAQAGGLKVLVQPPSGWEGGGATRMLRELDRHPALWAWNLADEPDRSGIPPAAVGEAHRRLRRAGARKPTALVLQHGANAGDYAGLTDILMIDRYPVPWLPLASFPQHVRLARLAAGARQPMMAVIQAFDWSAHPRLLPGETNLRPPTRDEIRCMTYCALVRGADGIFYYCHDDGAWRMREHPAVWTAVQEVVREVNDRKPLFTGESLWWSYVHRFGDRERRHNEALESSIAPALIRVREGNQTVPAGDYVVAVNTTAWTHRYGFRLPRPLAGDIAVVGENRVRPLEQNWVEDEFGPYAVHVYGPLPFGAGD